MQTQHEHITITEAILARVAHDLLTRGFVIPGAVSMHDQTAYCPECFAEVNPDGGCHFCGEAGE